MLSTSLLAYIIKSQHGQTMQAVSSRPDVTPPDYLKELEKLQDQIPAFDTKEAMQVMEAELGYPPSNLFSTLATAPSAAASLGQVSLPLRLLVSATLAVGLHPCCVSEAVFAWAPFSQHVSACCCVLKLLFGQLACLSCQPGMRIIG